MGGRQPPFVSLNHPAALPAAHYSASCCAPLPPSPGCVPVVRMLLAAGAKAGATVAGGFTALHIAAESGNMEVVELLLQVRARPDASRVLGVVLKRCTSQPSRAAQAEVAELLLLVRLLLGFFFCTFPPGQPPRVALCMLDC